jgi:hypothetical protein
MKKITEQQKDKLIAKCHGSYAGIDMQVLMIDEDGVVFDAKFIRPGCFIVAEDAYAYTIRYVNIDKSLSEVKWD